MEIELLEPRRMTQTGGSLLRLIQNNNMPILDLFVRESIQNSLDAAEESAKYVDVSFIKGEFDSATLAEELSDITSALYKKYPESYYKYLAVRDSNTYGLTGPMNYDEIRDGQYGNLLKLVYEICKPQEQEGAGGSWGLGKTVYFRVGIGIVIYYSRIRIGDGFQSRLVATLVEDEKSVNTMLPSDDSHPSTGIAWWGRKTGENTTEPVTEDAEIQRILAAFNLAPYTEEQTGTTIIIPYINEDRLLKNNAIQYEDADGRLVEPYWRASTEQYLRIAVQRWYCPRLNNAQYPNGKYLHASINGDPITSGSMEPFFGIIRTLYNRANDRDADFLFPVDNDCFGTDRIALRNIFIDTTAGKLAYIKVAKADLQMTPPGNKLAPYFYINTEKRSTETNAPIVCFVRKPGMIVSYDTTGDWVDGIPPADPDHYIIGIFVLNSAQKFKEHTTECVGLTLEEYVRKCEMADHTSWRDYSLGTYNPRVIFKIQNGVIKRLAEKFNPVKDATDHQQNSSFGKLFGEMLLPPQNFGKRPSPQNGAGNPSGQIAGQKRSVKLCSIDNSIRYSKGSMQLVMQITGGQRFGSAEICLGVDSESGTITPSDWIKGMGLKMPFTIADATIQYNSFDSDAGIESEQTLDYEHTFANGTVFTSEEMLLDGDCVGIVIRGDGLHSLNALVTIRINLMSRREQAVIYLGETEEAAI